MIWEKDHFANALTAKKAPLNYYEDVLVFSK
jgi:site-specific DNA-methyltransferase (adenine-specific)